MNDDLQLWDRQEGETAKSFAAFVLYRDGGATYSLRQLVEEHFGGKPSKLRTVEGWSSTYNWVARRQAYHDDLDRIRQLRRREAIGSAEDKLIEALPEIMAASIKKAKSGDPRATKDLLDRAGLTRKKADGAENQGLNVTVEALQVIVQHMSVPELLQALGQLQKAGK